MTAERRRSSRLKAVGLRPIEVGGLRSEAEKGKIESLGQKESGLRIQEQKEKDLNYLVGSQDIGCLEPPT